MLRSTLKSEEVQLTNDRIVLRVALAGWVDDKRIELQRAAAVRAGGEKARIGVGRAGEPESPADHLGAFHSDFHNRVGRIEEFAAVETAAGEMIVPAT